MVMLLSCNIYQDYCCCCFVVDVVVGGGVGVGAIHNLGDFKTEKAVLQQMHRAT